MRAMVLQKPRSPLVPETRKTPKPLAGEVLVEIAACGVCRTDLHVVDGEPIQEVYVTGQDGMAVLAVYTMQQQPDGAWKINGCSLYPVPDVSV